MEQYSRAPGYAANKSRRHLPDGSAMFRDTDIPFLAGA